MIGVRTKEGLAAAKSKGVRIGRPPLVALSVIDRIVADRAGGFTYRAIADAQRRPGTHSRHGSEVVSEHGASGRPAGVGLDQSIPLAERLKLDKLAELLGILVVPADRETVSVLLAGVGDFCVERSMRLV